MPLDGTLQDLSLPNLIQLQCSEQRRAQIRVTRRHQQGIIVIEDSQVVHAQLDALTGDDAMYELLTWDAGEFRVSDDIPTWPARNIATPWQTLVLEGLRRSDEAKSERKQLVAETAQQIRAVEGVADWFLITRDGFQVNASGDCGASDTADWLAATAQRAARVGALTQWGAPLELIAANNKSKWLIAPRQRLWLCVSIAARASVASARATLARSERG